MNWVATAALLGWPLVVAIVFAMLRAPVAVLVTYVGGWLFLPVAGLELFGFLNYDKGTAVPLVITLAIAVFDGRRLSRFRLRKIDLAMLAFCAVPLASSLSNGLGLYDGLSAAAYQTIAWGLPYLAGRLYCSSPDGLRRLAIAMLGGGLVYVPLCLWEIRMSPQLHHLLYGFHQHDWTQVFRGGGYRPMVFMEHGLMVALWMTAASLLALAVYLSGAARRVWGLPPLLALVTLVATTVLCKSLGAIILLVAGAAVLLSTRALRASLPMALLLCLPAAYVTARISGDWSGSELTRIVRGFSAERADSLAYRLSAEEKLRVKAMEHPLLGWGGWGRSFVRQSDDPGRTGMVTTDSLWIIVVGKHGLLGLVSLLAVFALPVLTLWRRCPPSQWARPEAVCAWALALVLTVYALDNLVNAMHNPIFLVIAGGLCGLALSRSESRGRVAGGWRALSLPAGADVR